jgi:hypothetical protein
MGFGENNTNIALYPELSTRAELAIQSFLGLIEPSFVWAYQLNQLCENRNIHLV